ncbi:helix-turn-helix domain-containing protein [Chitinophaga oryziterrae]|uniref:Helix-turn-helix domain-containing protein n=1 Tax=Chitinophaga oryziterrae TaxID=1031224 RepID=A0A6N8JL49_9BACT|nr:helix-turn-helix transcriptional regulator [Chitinophaga oryziterrae]MVT45139.1 helix-turn-helix domain-containing protein [Chitinophaga oryziterrae]
MNLANNIKTIREEKGLMQKDVANHIGVDKSTYSKIEKGLREITVAELLKMSQLFNCSIDQIVNNEGQLPREVILEDKSTVEQMRLIQQLEEEDKQIILRLIDKMLTNKKFKDFFQKNITAL